MHDSFITDWPTSDRFPHYTRANAGEVLADPVTPLCWSLCWEGAMVLGLRDGWIRGGTHELEDFDPDHPETVAMFGGYLYVNLSSCRLQGVRNPTVTVEALDAAFFGEHDNVPPYSPHPEDQKPHLLNRIESNTAWTMTDHGWPELLEDKAAAAELSTGRGDLGTYTDVELVARARELRPIVRHLFEQHTVSTSASALGPAILAAVGDAIGDPTIPMKLLAGLGDVDSALPSYALWDMSRKVQTNPTLTRAFDAGLDDVIDRLRSDESEAAQNFVADWDSFIVEYGSRGPNEWDIGHDTWETKPQLALAALERVRHQTDEHSPRARHTRIAAQRHTVAAQVRSRVADTPELAARVEGALVAGKMLAYRERTKTTIIRVVHECRMAMRELAGRHAKAGHIDEPGHMFMLLESELDDFLAVPTAFAALLASRARSYADLYTKEPPFIIADGQLDPIGQWPERVDIDAISVVSGETIVGVSGSPGQVRGTARVVIDPGRPEGLEPGDILIAPHTDPSWAPLFMTAGGLVVNVCGQISHSVIVSRELGIPCVVSATDATDRIPDGATIEIDGDTGKVTVIELP